MSGEGMGGDGVSGDSMSGGGAGGNDAGAGGALRIAGGRAWLPAPVNAHDHGYGIRTLDFGCPDDALEPWAAALRLRPRVDPELEARIAFGRVALSGCAGTMHCHNSLNADRLVDEAAAVVRAARATGIRLGLSCPLLDASPFVYGGMARAAEALPPEDAAWLAQRAPRYAPVPEQIAAVAEIARQHRSDMIDVQLGPIGPQWCSDALLEAIAEASARLGLRVHMHLLESPRQRAWLDGRFPGGVVQRLAAIGLLSPRLAVAHGVQLTEGEAEVLAGHGVILVSNPSANLRLRSGILPRAVTRRMRWAVGLDGTGFDDEQDIWAELRLFALLHAGRGLAPEVSPAEVLDAACRTGAAVVGCGGPEDVVAVDWAALTADALLPDDVPEARLLARMSRAHVRDLEVAGEPVVREGRLAGFDFDAARSELVAQARADAGRLAAARPEARRIAALVRQVYAGPGAT